jgi:hypothetical protein
MWGQCGDVVQLQFVDINGGCMYIYTGTDTRQHVATKNILDT